MKYLTFLSALSLIVFAACNSGRYNEDIPESATPDNAHNSRNALDWPGVYKGTLPCADCPGIETRISLHSDGTYTRTVNYIDRENGMKNDEGVFTWNEAGSSVTLTASDGSTQAYQVGENVLFHLDKDGNAITGDLAEDYKLRKNMTNRMLEGKNWVLTELRGQPVSEDDVQIVPNIEFNMESGRFAGNSGCNNFFGQYELMDGNRINMGKAASTMKACPDMTIEDQFLEVLGTVDNYNVTDTTLVLNRARMAPLARFKARDAEG